MKTIRKWTKDDVPPKRYPRYKLFVTDIDQDYGDTTEIFFFHTRFFAERQAKTLIKRYRRTFKEAILIDTRAEDT